MHGPVRRRDINIYGIEAIMNAPRRHMNIIARPNKLKQA